MKIQYKSKLNYKQAFKLSLVINGVLLAIGLLLFINSPTLAAARLSRIGSTGQTTSYKLRTTNKDIVFVECNNGTPNLGLLSNQEALTCQ
ncbi:MAG: hypothetical protein ACHBN1_10140 [Heteroscytonema crispum UTEX LB 1556]